MRVAITVNIGKANNKTRLINDRFLKSMEANSKLVARMAAFQLHKSTLPETFSMPWNNAFIKMKDEMHLDIKSSFTTKKDYAWQGIAFRLIKDYINEDRAKKWYNNYKTGGLSTFNERSGTYVDYEEEFDRMRGIPRKANEEEYLAHRKANKYKVPRSWPDRKVLGFVTEDKRKKLINKRIKTAGLAKAGWKACYHLAGGKGLNVSQMGAEGQNRFPPEINIPYNLFGKTSLGSVNLSHNNTGYQGKLINHVRYVSAAMKEEFVGVSIAMTEQYMKIVFELRRKSLKKELKKAG